jgi:hypothetical protein
MPEEDIEKVKEIISSSGNNFHCTVFNGLKERDWAVQISPYYNDNVTDKPREIDLIAEKNFQIEGRFGSRRGGGCVSIRLFIECKYIPQKNIFWFHEKDKLKAKELIVNITPFEDSDDAYIGRHHYFSQSNDAAKLFATEKMKKAENELIYQALNQSLNAMIYFRDSTSIIPDGSERIQYDLIYPVIICNNFDNFYGVNIGSDDEPFNVTSNFQLEVNYAYLNPSRVNINEYFLIDIINNENLEDFLSALQSDVDNINRYLRLLG